MTQTPQEVTTRAYQWIVQRDDGVGFATTSHDRAQAMSEITANPDMDLRPSDLVLTDRLEGSYVSVNGGLSSPALAADDLLAGRWNGAGLRLMTSDWAKAAASVTVCEGELGDVRVDKGRIDASLNLLPTAARQPPCIQTSPECRAILGDRHCRIDMRGRRQRVQVLSSDVEGFTIDFGDTSRFVMGRLRWISGRNSGLDQLIIAGKGAKLTLQGNSHLRAGVGDRAMLFEGCDGQRSTCSQRFGNVVNFRGEPDLPGSAILMRFPGA